MQKNRGFFLLVLSGIFLLCSIAQAHILYQDTASYFQVRAIVDSTEPGCTLKMLLPIKKNFWVSHNVILKCEDLDSVFVRPANSDTTDECPALFQVMVRLTSPGTQSLTDYAHSHLGTRIGVVVADTLISVPRLIYPGRLCEFPLLRCASLDQADLLVGKLIHAMKRS